MPDKSVYSFVNIALSALGGLAGAAVFAVLGRAEPAGVLLAQLSPLPVMIIALGLGVGHGATAALIGAVTLTFALNPLFGMAYGLFVALPAWSACYAAAGAPWWGRRDLLKDHVSSHAATALCATLSAAVILFLGLAFFSHGTIEEPLAYIQGLFFVGAEEALKEQNLSDAVSKEQLSAFVKLGVPALIASSLVMLHALNLWIAGRLTQISGMLKQPWPDIAKDFALSRGVAIAFVIAAPMSFLGGFAGQAALVVAATTSLALGLQGLAVAHYWLRGSKSGVVTLSILYFVVGLLVLPIALFAIIGLVDQFAHFRGKALAAGQDGATQQS